MFKKVVKEFICSETEPVVATKAGKLRGFKMNDVYNFRGIKYADAERFQMPKEVEPWEGVKDAQDYGFICPYRPDTTFVGVLAFPKRYWLTNEHCQYLNVWTKSLSEEAKKPVIVWLHGGGFAHGSCLELECYDGENMADYGDVVVVSLNHRLNIYGFLDLSDYGPEYENSNILGMEDIVMALKWIQDNISKFGGDPKNVTILGESGGGGKVRTLMQMSSADGLYHKAICDSGILPGRTGSVEEEKAAAKAQGRKIVEAAGGIENLKKMNDAELLATIDKALGNHFFGWGPAALTGTYEGEWHNAGYRKETLDIPMIVGSTFTELNPRPESMCDKSALTEEEKYQALVDAYGEEGAALIKEEFEKAYPELNLYYAANIDCLVRRPSKEFCVRRIAEGGENTYNFLFAAESKYKGGILTTHADELAFVFHNVEYIGALYGGEITAKLQEEIFRAFIQFAYTGNPNHEGISEWKKVSKEHNCFVFSTASSNREAHDEKLMELVGRYSKNANPFH